jgi:hypothetical protein
LIRWKDEFIKFKLFSTTTTTADWLPICSISVAMLFESKVDVGTGDDGGVSSTMYTSSKSAISHAGTLISKK